MPIERIRQHLGDEILLVMEKENIKELRPAQVKALNAGLLDRKNLLVCTPTASGKTFIAELAILHSVRNKFGKAVYIVPLKALASEKYEEFKRKWAHLLRVAISVGDMDSEENYLADYDLIICTSEKLDSLTRHQAPWLTSIATVVIDEIHLLNDPGRGPVLEVLITLLRKVLKNVQIIGLSATIGNPEMLAEWLSSTLVQDDWRPVELKKGVYLDGKITFDDITKKQD